MWTAAALISGFSDFDDKSGINVWVEGGSFISGRTGDVASGGEMATVESPLPCQLAAR